MPAKSKKKVAGYHRNHWQGIIGISNINHTQVEVREIRYGFGQVLGALHKGSILELDDPMLTIWAYYAQIATVCAFICIAISIYFWAKKSLRSARQWTIAILSVCVSLVFILYIWLVG